MYRAMIVDDHPFIRASVRLLLEKMKVKVVAETDNGADAVQMVRDYGAQLVILDIGMPKMDGLEVIQRIKALELPVKILVLTSQAPDYFSLRCMKVGAAGYVCKSDNLTELVKAVQAVTSGYTYFPDVALSSVHRGDCLDTEAQCIARLTDRELLILQQLARGYSNKAIGDAMLLSNKTVSTYKARLIEKLRVQSLVDLADLARRHALI
ncbi:MULTISPECIES: response regulator transcription factor [Pseudomonas]|uniref:Response regulator transcription factor n=1 Tax=Pseudomonas eucalypticola TaxID=2599595 RepID=A0A7D5D8J6_9PSED|nr:MULTISPECIES: response regulator transcription factor [Pseudomonas]QKZ05498.1 response regulator transcription factor [Pseudomonas eucalypticola]